MAVLVGVVAICGAAEDISKRAVIVRSGKGLYELLQIQQVAELCETRVPAFLESPFGTDGVVHLQIAVEERLLYHMS